MGSHVRPRRPGPESSSPDGNRDSTGQRFFFAAPLVLQWMATLRCPLNCSHCLSATDKEMADMPLDAALDLVRQAAAAGVQDFLVTGGEPLVREDLPEVIEALGKEGLPWSLNTACMPGPDIRRAMERHPPAFVAVSLDGPQQVHDSFRGRDGAWCEAMEAIRYFSSSIGCEVTAGTTVTTHNYPLLEETFHIAANSGATAWGLHLLVPEGRAKERRELFLSRKQLKRLLPFVARKRHYFRVGLADEFGYCGDWEVLVRDVPLLCGAGRAQCVVLPSGDVVPCTTIDLSTSAGNLNSRTLMEIWRDGFAELRRNTPGDDCRGCGYFTACRGGCWLQRRDGEKCFKDTWEIPGLLKTAAGVALCLGLAAAGGDVRGQERPAAPKKPAAAAIAAQPEKRTRPQWQDKPLTSTETGAGIESWIVQWYGAQLPSLRRRPHGRQPALWKADPETMPPELAADPAGSYFLNFIAKGVSPETVARAQHTLACLATKQRSMALAALLWRNLLEPTLDGADPALRSMEDRHALADTLTTLAQTAESWRKEILEGKLDPYLARDRVPLIYRFEMSKAMIPAPSWLVMTRDTQSERWGVNSNDDSKKEATDDILKRHPLAGELRLVLSQVPRRGLELQHSPGKEGDHPIFDIFTLAETGKQAINVTLRWLHDEKNSYDLLLPAGAQLTYIDLLRLVHQQHGDTIRKKTGEARVSQARHVMQTNPLFLVHQRNIVKAHETPHKEGAPESLPDGLDSARAYLADFWMY